MGLGDTISRILIDVKADTKSAKSALHELNGSLEAMGKAAAFAREAMTEYDDHLRLVTATANVNIDSLSKAFRGLVNEHDLLTFAAQTQTGILALNQQEMEKVAQAALALRNRGFGAEEALKKLTDAAVKGKVGGLDDLGLSIKEGASHAETLRNMMTELDKVIKDSGPGYNQAAEDVRRLGVEWDDAAAAAKRYTVEVLKAIDFNKINELKTIMETGGVPVGDAMAALVKRDRDRAALETQQLKDRAAASLEQKKAAMAVIEMPDLDVSRKPGKSGGAKKKPEEDPDNWNLGIARANQASSSDLNDLLSMSLGFGPASSKENQEGFLSILNTAKESAAAILGSAESSTEKIAAIVENMPEEGPTLLERLGLDDPSAFDMAAATLQTFTSAYAESMQAIGESSMAGADIAKHAFAEVIRGIGSQLAAKGAAEAVEGAALLITGNPMGAAHLGAAALYSGGSIAAYAAAAAIDGGKGGGKGGGSSGAPASAGGGRGSTLGGSISSRAEDQAEKNKSSRPLVVVLGSSFDKTTPRERARSAQDALNVALMERDE